jgi:hypothetical protein
MNAKSLRTSNLQSILLTFYVITVMTLKICAFWNRTTCILVETYRRFVESSMAPLPGTYLLSKLSCAKLLDLVSPHV